MLKFIEENAEISAKEIAIKLNVTERTVERDIEKLRKTDRIKRIGADKGGYWLITKPS